MNKDNTRACIAERITQQQGTAFSRIGFGLIFGAATCWLLFSSLSCEKKVLDTQVADEKALREIEADWVKSSNAKDADRIASFFSPNGVQCPPNAQMETGPAQIRAAQQRIFARPGPVPTVSNELRLVEVAQSGDLAVTHGTYAESGTGLDGKPASDKGKWVTVYKKQPNGTWKAILDISNSDMPLPPKQ